MNETTSARLLAVLTDAFQRKAHDDRVAATVAVIPDDLAARIASELDDAVRRAALQTASGHAGQLSRQLVRRLAGLATPVVRAVLARPRAKRMVLALLARSPRLYARAYQLMLQPAAVKEQAAAANEASLSPRTRALFQALGRGAAMPPSGSAPDTDWDALIGAARTRPIAAAAPGASKRRLAFVSPLPPERTGIADYAVQLLPELITCFDIELVVRDRNVALPPALAGLPLRDLAWFDAHATGFDQILYQFGNSEFHSHMFDLLQRHPGVIVLHDFFLSNVLAFKQVAGDPPGAWNDALFHSHGYAALRESQDPARRATTLKKYPCNRAVLDTATGVIVHSEHAAQLATHWYGPEATGNWTVVPLPRSAPPIQDRAAARAALGIANDTFLVCSFGYIGPNKLTHRLLEAWMTSALGAAPECQLVLVGANHASPYGAQIADTIRAAGLDAGIGIAGWSDESVYRLYLQAADVAVQLRTSAQGETSAAVLDCLNYALPTIVNANGSMAALPENAVWRLPDDFATTALGAALETLRADGARRAALGATAAAVIERNYRPAQCAQQYRAALERALAGSARGEAALLRALAAMPAVADDAARAQVATRLARVRPPLMPRQLLLDIGALRRDGAGAPGHAVALGHVLALLKAEDPGVRVEPVYLEEDTEAPQFRYARSYTGMLLDIAWNAPGDLPVDAWPGDMYYSPDAPSDYGLPGHAAALDALRGRGVALGFLVPGVAGADGAWLEAAARQAACMLCEDHGQASALAASLAQVGVAP